MPNSASRPRTAFMCPVRCCTIPVRAVSKVRAHCCATLLIATVRIDGRRMASQIASASRAAVLLRLTKGFT
jgi:hypothetical protein